MRAPPARSVQPPTFRLVIVCSLLSSRSTTNSRPSVRVGACGECVDRVVASSIEFLCFVLLLTQTGPKFTHAWLARLKFNNFEILLRSSQCLLVFSKPRHCVRREARGLGQAVIECLQTRTDVVSDVIFHQHHCLRTQQARQHCR